MQPGSKTALALRVLREQAGNNTGGWVVYGDLLALMDRSDGRSIHWALDLLTRRGHIEVRVHHGRRFSYRITPEGKAFLTANRAAIDELMARAGDGRRGGREGVPAPVVRAMENLKLAMRLRLRKGEVSEEAAEAIAAALDLAAKTVEKS